ncbi:cell division protein FtsA [Casimicrobium huifangae]|uniref:cell division protein FtsA n=1 Tax=Casimicrobium huifangae TaxID=2591109 RepID=UPI001EE34F09|nr:cell division protein FtsA [Casimicrobium huifangae]
MSELIAALDIGTSKVVALVAELDAEQKINVIGFGEQPSLGLRKGMVVDIDATTNTVAAAVREAAAMANCKISNVYVGIAGAHIRSLNSSGMVAMKDSEVTEADMERVIETAKAIAIPNDQVVLHTLPQEYIIDGQEGVRRPLGMSGRRLEVKVHIVTGAVSAAENIEKCVRRCGLNVQELVLQPLASAAACLTRDEMEIGVGLVDIGGGTTDFALFTGGAIRHTGVIPVAGDQITNDIAMALRTPSKEAADIKHRYACALTKLVEPEELIEVPSVADRPAKSMPRHMLAEVVEPRVEELFQLVHEQIKRSGFEPLLRSGIALTGGSAMLPGMVELGEEVFHMPVRVAVPDYRGPLKDVLAAPKYATAIGLLMHGRDQLAKQAVLRRRESAAAGMFAKLRDAFGL